MTAVTGASQPGTGRAAGDRSAIGFGLGPDRKPSGPNDGSPPPLKFSALDGLGGLAVPFVLAFALRSDIARLNPPAPVQYLADGGYVLVPLFFVLIGFLLCRPLTGVLAGSGATALGSGLLRRIAPLHLVAWLITAGWVLSGAGLTSTPAPGRAWDWLSSALLLNGVVGPERTGYPVSWSVSVALGCVILLTVAALALSSWTGRLRATTDGVRPPSDSGRQVTVLAVLAGLAGTALLALAGPEAIGTVGPAAIGQGLLGIGAGILGFRVLEGGTGTVRPPLPGTAPAPRPAPGLGSLLAGAALLFCLYRSDLMHQLDLLPVFLVAAVLVYSLAVPHASGRGPLNRALDTRPLQWLGSRALALYLLHGPVQLTVERVCELRHLDRESTPVTYGVLTAVVLGSLIAADLGHRLLERPLTPPAPEPVAAVSMYRQPRSRPERISQIDPEAIPSELRLLPLPRKTAAAAAATAAGEAGRSTSDRSASDRSASDRPSSGRSRADTAGGATPRGTSGRRASSRPANQAASPDASKATAPGAGRAAASGTGRTAASGAGTTVPGTGKTTAATGAGTTVPGAGKATGPGTGKAAAAPAGNRAGAGKTTASGGGQAAPPGAGKPAGANTPGAGKAAGPAADKPAGRATRAASGQTSTGPNTRPIDLPAGKTLPSKAIRDTPNKPADVADEPANRKPARRPGAKPFQLPPAQPLTRPSDGPPAKPAAKAAPAPKPARSAAPSVPSSAENPAARTVKLPAEKSTDAAKSANKTGQLPADRAATKSVQLPADQPPSEAEPLPTNRGATKSVQLPADETVQLPADKPTRKTSPRKPTAKLTDQPIDLDRPTPEHDDPQVLDADAQP